MPHRVDAAMHGKQLTTFDSSADRAPSDARVQKLTPRDQPMLAPRHLPNTTIHPQPIAHSHPPSPTSDGFCTPQVHNPSFVDC